MFKKIISVFLAVCMIAAFGVLATSCSESDESFKVGFICLHDEKSTYDLNFLDAAKAAQKALGLSDEQVIIKTNIEEGNACYEAARDLVNQGCSVIFANSFGHEQFLIQAAKEFKDVHFCHATGTQSKVVKLDNYHNAFASIYEGRYLAGVAAGMKLNEMIAAGQFTAEEAKMGYVGAFTYAEVISGYTSFYLGAKSVCPTVTMDVQFTGSWYDAVEEKNAAEALIAKGCKLISQHADSMGAPSACEEKNIPNVSYNGSTVETCPKTFIISSKIDWQPYFERMISTIRDGQTLETDWCGTLKTGSVKLTDINTAAAAAGTAEKIADVKAQLEAGTLKVFNTNTFTVTVTEDKNQAAKVDANGHLTEYLADVDGDFTGEINVVHDGYFDESGDNFRSAPYFDLQIDGITLLNAKF